jgi:Metallo-peptidase family M12/Secretion system C-terminal sorting domain
MKKILLFVAVMLTAISFGQDQFWQKVSSSSLSLKDKVIRDSQPTESVLYSLDLNLLKAKLQTAPSRKSQTSNVIVAFPNELGELENYRIYEASVLQSELAAKSPEIQSYIGKGIDNPTATIRFSTTLFGLHVMNFSERGTSFIDPYTKDLQNYIVYNKANIHTNRGFECGVKDAPPLFSDEELGNMNLMRSENSLFKTYRLALACTIEYAAFHVNAAGLNAGTLAQKKNAVLAAMAVTMTRVNGVYEKDLAITLTIINNNLNIINITSDTYTNANGSLLLDENQAAIDATIGTANYDIGHVVSTGGGGIAQLGSPCTASKARGVTGSPAPVGDPFDIDYVAHEMGHQFGGQHTFNSVAGSCGGNRSAGSAFEPGSGTTIMAYAGICSPEDVQSNSNDYFHARSLIQIFAFINAGGNCGVILPNGNTPPVVSAGSNYSIPIGTPFVLTALATDIDNPLGDQLTYCWEQYNATITAAPLLPTNTTGPNFRSYNPTSSPLRYFPKYSDILAGNLAPTWELIPTVGRAMLFSVVVRDNGGPNGGQTKRATTTITTVAGTGPFTFGTISGRNTEALILWNPGETRTINWNVNNTNTLPGGANVNIKFSIDGGLTFPYDIALNTPNDGTEDIVVPVTPPSQNCRLKIEAVDNIFFTINSGANPIYTGYTATNTCNTYNFTGAAFAIPNGTGSITKTIAVPVSNSVTDVNVSIDATHSNLQNLVIAMTRPGSGTQFQLFNQQCTGSANMNVTFDQQSPPLVCASPTTGSYAPSGTANLSLLNVNIPAGNFSVNFKDALAGADSGTVNSFSITICKNEFTQTNLLNLSFNFKDFALYPNPNAGSFTVRFNSSNSSKVAINVSDISGRKIFEKSYTNSGLFDENIQLDKAQAGIYLVSITDGDKKIVKRIVIE